jgi:predicted nucleic acid-binding protein
MANNLFLDTNVLVHLLDGNKKVLDILQDKTIHISFVTEMELLSKKLITKKEIAIINALLDSCKIYDFNESIKTAAIILMRNNRLKMPDAIIAATASYYEIEMITGDAKFINITGCTIINYK